MPAPEPRKPVKEPDPELDLIFEGLSDDDVHQVELSARARELASLRIRRKDEAREKARKEAEDAAKKAAAEKKGSPSLLSFER